MTEREKNTKMTIDIANNFAREPAGRTPVDGAYNGKTFREEYLIPALRDNDTVEVILDGTGGYGSSFLEEAFGGLVRHGHFNHEQLKEKLKLVANDKPYRRYKRLAERHIAEAEFGVTD